MAKSTTTSCLSSTIYRRNTDQIDWESAKCITYSQTTIKDPHSGFTNLKKTLLNGSQRFPAPYKWLIGGIKKTNHERTTGRLPVWLTINDCLTVKIDGSKRTNDITSLQPELYHQLTWCNSLWIWRWLPHRSSKNGQSLSTTTVLFRTVLNRAIIFNLLLIIITHDCYLIF